jgi:NAD(P) transhydrogenase subunit beta
VVAFGKLQGLISARPVTYPAQQVVNGALALIIVGLSLYMLAVDNTNVFAFTGITIAALILGVAVVMPIGGADMPVVISLLNSFTGLAVAMNSTSISRTTLSPAPASPTAGRWSTRPRKKRCSRRSPSQEDPPHDH